MTTFAALRVRLKTESAGSGDQARPAMPSPSRSRCRRVEGDVEPDGECIHRSGVQVSGRSDTAHLAAGIYTLETFSRRTFDPGTCSFQGARIEAVEVKMTISTRIERPVFTGSIEVVGRGRVLKRRPSDGRRERAGRRALNGRGRRPRGARVVSRRAPCPSAARQDTGDRRDRMSLASLYGTDVQSSRSRKE